MNDMTPPAPMGRRRFLRRSLSGAAALGVASALVPARVRARSRNDAPGKLQFFTEEEYLVFSGAAARLTGHYASGPGNRVDAALRADRFLGTEDPEIQDQIHLLLTIFNSLPAAVLLGFTFSKFIDMDGTAQDKYLEGWMTSSFAFRRTAFQALKRLAMSMYYTDEGAWEEIGYHGIVSPGEGR